MANVTAEQTIKVKVKVLAYEKGSLPVKLSQLQNDVPYATQQWVGENFSKPDGYVDGGIVTKDGALIPGKIFDGGVVR